MMNNIQKGIAPLIILLIVAVVGVIASGTIYVNKKLIKEPKPDVAKQTEPAPNTEVAEEQPKANEAVSEKIKSVAALPGADNEIAKETPPIKNVEIVETPIVKEKVIETPPVVIEVEIPWHIELVALDGVNVETMVRAPFEEATKFISDRSRFKLEYGITVVSEGHTYTHYDCGEGKQKCVVVNAKDLASNSIASLPNKMSYILFWRARENPPLQAGSTWGVPDGLVKDGNKHAYATIPTDLWWYNNSPYEGFDRRSAQIIAHETINIINTILENPPYNCAPLIGTGGDPAVKYEGDRLAKLTDECYTRLPSVF